MRPLGLLRSLVSLALCTATWAMDPTDTIMDAGQSSLVDNVYYWSSC